MDRIALADHAFDKHSGIDPSHSVMRLCHVEQDARLRLAGLLVDRDHLAARVTLEDGEAQPAPRSGGCARPARPRGTACPPPSRHKGWPGNGDGRSAWR